MLSRRVAALQPSIIRQMSNRRRPTSIDLSLGEPRLEPDREAMSAAWQNLQSGLQGYTKNAGLDELRAEIARYHALPGRDAAENVIVTVGSEEAVYLAMTSLLDPGDEVLVPQPGYPAYRGIAQLIGATPVDFPIHPDTGLAPRADALQSRLTERARVIVLNGPSNPFGTVDDADELAAIAALAEANDVTIISDEIYRSLYYCDAPPPSVTERLRSSVFISGLSKSCAMTGLRLGYLIADAGFVKQATLAHQLMVTCAPRLAQLAALEVFRSPERLRAHVPYYRRSREVLREAAEALPSQARLHVGEGAFYGVIDVSAFAEGDPMALAIELFEAEDVIVVPGVAFGPSGDWFWRLSYAAGEDVVREGVARIARFLNARC